MKVYTKYVFVFTLALLFVSAVHKAEAQVVGLPVSGRIAFILPCVNGLYIVVASVDPKSAGPYIITPAVIPRLWGIVLPGYAFLGRYLPGMQCIIPPIVLPTKGMILEFGTSLVPSVF